MKTLLILISLCLGISIHGISQTTYYYNETKTFKEDGYTYQCDVPSYNIICLYNKENKLTYVDERYKSTGEIYAPEPEEYIPLMSDEDTDTWTRPLCYTIVNNAFTEEQAKRTKGWSFMITMCISSETGKVLEVYFEFVNSGPFATIPVSVYRNIETELKEKVWFNISPEGKKLNYIQQWWRQEVGERIKGMK